MFKARRIAGTIYTAVLFLILLSGCEKSAGEQTGTVSPFASFRDIPGVTEDEIKAVEALREQYPSFVYGSMPSTEAFLDEHGNLRGYSALFCEWLSELFGIPFVPEHLPIDVFLERMASFEVSFTGDMTASEERRKVFFMTDAIAEHAVRSFRIAGSEPLELIAQSRPLRYAFIPGSTNINDVTSQLEPGTYEVFLINNTDEIYYALQNREIDAFFSEGLFEAVFDSYSDVVARDFFPLTYAPVSLTTQNPALKPVIDVVQKALENGAMRYLTGLYNQGYREYQRHKLFLLLSEEELVYLQSNPVVPILAKYDNYPVSFYNTHENQWQGCAFDVLNEIEMFTGLSFKVFNDHQTEYAELLRMLQNGEAAMITELPYLKGLEGLYLWPGNTILTDNFALLSKSDRQRLNVNEILHTKVGLIEDTAAALLFNNWFPAHPDLVYYKSADDAFNALENSRVDIIMATLNNLLMLTNLQERSNYKANIIFDATYSSTFGFNKNEDTLCSIVDKALALVETKVISEDWARRVYDYEAKLVQTQRSWLFAASVLSLFVFVLIFFLLQKSLSAGKRLRSMLVQYEVLWESVQSGVAVIDVETRKIIDANSSAVRMFGGTKEDLIGKPCNTLFEVGDNCPILDQKQTIQNEERAFRKSNGECIPAIKSVVNIEYNGRAALLESFTDISHIKKAQEAASASEAKSQFIANMSHEMRTPMNVVVGLTDLLLEEDDPSLDLKDNLRKISTAGNTLLSLINDVLDISKIEAGKLELMPVQYDMPSLLSDIITLNMIRIESKPIVFQLDINEGLPSCLYGDDLRVKQIINNLLSNAFKYTQKGNVTLGVSCSREDCSEDVLMSVYVNDTGIGIREDDLKKLFTDYSQVDTRTNRSIEGTGLGLSITKMLVEHMDGEISVESEYGKGTTFHLRIRQGFVSDKTIGREMAESLCSFRYLDNRKSAYQKLVRPNLDYASVLIVDDMQTNLDVASGMLKKYKMHVDCVTNGREAIDRIKNGKPVYDAIFMDHMMPGMDGIEATKMIRGIGTKYAMTIPIIALTANAIAGNEQMFLKNDFQAFLPKPINLMNLDSVVQRWVRDKARE